VKKRLRYGRALCPPFRSSTRFPLHEAICRVNCRFLSTAVQQSFVRGCYSISGDLQFITFAAAFAPSQAAYPLPERRPPSSLMTDQSGIFQMIARCLAIHIVSHRKCTAWRLGKEVGILMRQAVAFIFGIFSRRGFKQWPYERVKQVIRHPTRWLNLKTAYLCR